MVPASEVPNLIVQGWKVLTHAEYAANQRYKNAMEDRFASFRLYVQHDSNDNPLGICPSQGDPGIGEWSHNANLFEKIRNRVSADGTPAKADKPEPNVRPEHKQAFLEYLANERDYAAHVNGAEHPAVKYKIYEHYIETVGKRRLGRLAFTNAICL